MNCEKCGAKLPDDSTVCPECGAEVEVSNAEARMEGSTAVRSQTVPQRPRTAYPDRSTSRQEARRRRNLRTVRVVVLAVVILALLAAAIYFGIRILNHGNEEPDLGEKDPVTVQPEDEQTETTDPTDEQEEQDEPQPPVTYDLAGVWVWDADMALMKETVWNFAEDGTLTIHYFGMGNPENPFDAWPSAYTYDKESGTLTLAGEKILLTWKNESSFTMNSTVLGLCDAKRTDADHIPTGAEDIRVVDGTMPEQDDEGQQEQEPNESAAYFFADSNSRYLKKSECDALTADELRLARNEIYARHGRKFDSEDLQNYFDGQDWYEGTISPSQFNYDVLNDYERYNVNLLKSIEDSKR